MDTFFEGFKDLAFCAEAVLFKLLRRHPDAAVVFLEMRTAVIPRKSGAILHTGAAQHYQVPVVSYEQALWPDYFRLLEALREHHYAVPHNETILPYPHGCHPCVLDDIIADPVFQSNGCQSVCNFQRWTEDWSLANCSHPPPGRGPCHVPFLAHDEVHPSGIGHKIAADLIIDAIAETSRDLCLEEETLEATTTTNANAKATPGATRASRKHRQQHKIPPLLERRDVIPRVGWMVGDPLIFDAKTNFIWVNDTYTMFTENNKLLPASSTKGFELLEDRFNRYGWIATNEAGGESITFRLGLSTNDDNCYIPYLSVLKSYEKMGQMVVTIGDRTRGKQTSVEIDSLWEPRISVPSDVPLIESRDRRGFFEHDVGCSGDSTITITTKPMVEGRSGNKVKIVTLSVRPCIPMELL